MTGPPLPHPSSSEVPIRHLASRRLRLRALALCAFAALTAPAAADAACAAGGYAYAGLESSRRAFGIRATISAPSAPTVRAGHVAAWVGVGGYGHAAGGGDAWLQVGIASFAGDARTHLYYEVTRPGAEPEYHALDSWVRPGDRIRVSVLKSRQGAGWWRVWVDGVRASDPVFLPGSNRGWEPVATTESWDGGLGMCNAFAFRFEHVALALRPGGSWRSPASSFRVLRDPGFTLRRSTGGFFAATT